MNDESLSALLDGECDPAELDPLLTRMNQDPALRERFGRMARAQQLRRSALVPRVPASFADRVMAALPERPDPVVVPLARPGAWPGAWRPAAALAAAAAVGAVAVLALKPDPQAVPAAQLPATATGPEADEAAVAQLDDDNARQLRNYLMTYSQSRGQHGIGGTLGYARYAAYTEPRVLPAGGAQDDGQGGSR